MTKQNLILEALFNDGYFDLSTLITERSMKVVFWTALAETIQRRANSQEYELVGNIIKKRWMELQWKTIIYKEVKKHKQDSDTQINDQEKEELLEKIVQAGNKIEELEYLLEKKENELEEVSNVLEVTGSNDELEELKKKYNKLKEDYDAQVEWGAVKQSADERSIIEELEETRAELAKIKEDNRELQYQVAQMKRDLDERDEEVRSKGLEIVKLKKIIERYEPQEHGGDKVDLTSALKEKWFNVITVSDNW